MVHCCVDWDKNSAPDVQSAQHHPPVHHPCSPFIKYAHCTVLPNRYKVEHPTKCPEQVYRLYLTLLTDSLVIRGGCDVHKKTRIRVEVQVKKWKKERWWKSQSINDLVESRQGWWVQARTELWWLGNPKQTWQRRQWFVFNDFLDHTWQRDPKEMCILTFKG